MKGPFVNLNGASRDSLIRQSLDVANAAQALIEALGRAAPHGRDYQTQDTNEAYRHDRDVWERFIRNTREMYEEYHGVAERLHTEDKERKRK